MGEEIAGSRSSKMVGSWREIQRELLSLIKSLQCSQIVDSKILCHLHLAAAEQKGKQKFALGKTHVVKQTKHRVIFW